MSYNGLPYYKRYPRDFIEGTIGMPFELKATYSVVLDLIYMQGGELPDDPRYIAGLLGVSVRKWNSLRQGLLDAGKLEVSGKFLTNYRALSELESSRKYQEQQRENRTTSKENKDLDETTVKRSSHQPEPEPDIKKEEPKGSSKKRGSRLPDDWRLPKAWGEWAVSEGMASDEVRRQAARFHDYWIGVPGSKGVKRDWQATWRNWIRKALSDSKPKNGQPEYGEVREINGVRKVWRGFDGWVRQYA